MWVFLFFLSITISYGQTYVEVSDHLQIDQTYQMPSLFGGGVSFADFDQDGWDDLTIATATGDSIQFYRNNQGLYQKVRSFVDHVGEAKQMLWVDLDNDLDLDLLIADIWGQNVLYVNDGSFTFTTVYLPSAQSNPNLRTFGLAVGDIDLDGDLDIFLANYEQPNTNYPNQLLVNEGNNLFRDITSNYFFQSIYQLTYAAIFFDANKDLWPDIVTAEDRVGTLNQFYLNRGAGVFSDESASSHLNVAVEGMGITAGDYNHDQQSDLYITNSYDGNLLFHNNGDLTFTDTALSLGVQCNRTSWSAHFLDYDNDTDLDIHVAATRGIYADKNCFYINQGNGRYLDSSAIFLSFDSTVSYSSALGDYNRDGYLDIAINNTFPDSFQCWKNNGGANNWLKIQLLGTSSNSMGIGAWIDVYIDSVHISHYSITGSGYLSQNALYHHFGLKNALVVDSLIVSWPSGHIDRMYSINANQELQVTEGSTAAMHVEILSSNNGLICPNDSTRLYTRGKYQSYIWSTGDTTQSIFTNISGVYYITVTDFNMNVSSDSLVISFANGNNIQLQVVPPSCSGFADGYAEIVSSGNTGLFTYNWSNNKTEASIDNLQSGQYSVMVQDMNGCIDTFSFTLNDPPPLTTNANLTQIPCFGDSTGQIELLMSGGTPPYQYNWSNAATGQTLTSLPMGQYSVYIEDSNTCSTVENYIIYSPLSSIQIQAQITDTICFGSQMGEILINPTGGIPPYDILWSTNDTSSSLSQLNAGVYALTVTDDNNCTSSFVDTIQQYDSLGVFFTTIPDTNGLGGAIYPTVTNQANVSYVWSNGSTNAFISQVPSGIYQVTITDSNGCDHVYSITIPNVIMNRIVDKSAQYESQVEPKIYPNPTTHQLTVDLQQNRTRFCHIRLKGIDGRVIQTYRYPYQQAYILEVKDLAVGTYMISIQTDQGVYNTFFVRL